ncbi:M20/M25/M40 family metallo-hydrolase (plasmid) [Mesorhizobium atlanticum]|uniref:M20/M25/M40 family metallo-hydrolase n=1 Tax=Mesorhizobium atlanticum TaxID=2233532 RepID=UPI003703AEA0
MRPFVAPRSGAQCHTCDGRRDRVRRGLRPIPGRAASRPQLRAGILILAGRRDCRGQAVNIIPNRCTADIEVRAVPGVSPSSLLEPVKARLLALGDSGFKVAWNELSSYPALAPANRSELATVLTELTGQEPLTAVSYGTEAGLYQQAGIDAIICGPGDISRAHRPNEYIEIEELAACRKMIEDLGARLGA